MTWLYCGLIAWLVVLAMAWGTAAAGTPDDTERTDGQSQEETTESRLDFASATRELEAACGDCHGFGADEGGFEVSELGSESSLRERFERWSTVKTRIAERSMPPSDYPPLEAELREDLTEWIARASVQAIVEEGPKPGPPLLRRLARYEYSNAIRDLLNIHFDAGQGLPQDTAGGEGFANAAETLIISPVHAEKYLHAATDALDYASRDQRARKRLLRSRPESTAADSDEIEAARENLERLARRAFRRPVQEDELDRFVQLYVDTRQDDLGFDESVLFAMRGILVSPSFLFISEKPPEQLDQPELLDDFELATRLSYFLWATTPDDALLEAAEAGKLSAPEELQRQTVRLMTDRGTHLQDSMSHFMGSWLGTDDLGRAKQIDRERHPWIQDPHVAALRKQPVVTMESILREDDSLLDLIDCQWAFLNNELVRMYKLKRDKIEGDFVQRLVRVELPDEYRSRCGLLGMGGVMAISAYPGRSSPVLRGAWILEKLLGIELPPPPPDVPALEEPGEDAGPMTLRQRLEQHRADAACATCHDRIDPLGFALENFDEIGRWREQDDGGKIDPRATLAEGRVIEGVEGLKEYLMEEKATFIRVLTRKMLGYALGRSLRPSDLGSVELIARRVEENDDRAHELVLGIVMSEPFRKKVIYSDDSE